MSISLSSPDAGTCNALNADCRNTDGRTDRQTDRQAVRPRVESEPYPVGPSVLKSIASMHSLILSTLMLITPYISDTNSSTHHIQPSTQLRSVGARPAGPAGVVVDRLSRHIQSEAALCILATLTRRKEKTYQTCTDTKYEHIHHRQEDLPWRRE